MKWNLLIGVIAVGSVASAEDVWLEETLVPLQEAQPVGYLSMSASGQPLVLEWAFGNMARIGVRHAAHCWEYQDAPFGNFGDFMVDGSGRWQVVYMDTALNSFDGVTVAHWDGDRWLHRVIDERRTNLSFDGSLTLSRDHRGKTSFTYYRAGAISLAWQDIFGGWKHEEVGTAIAEHQHSVVAYTSEGQPHVLYADQNSFHYGTKRDGGWVVEELRAETFDLTGTSARFLSIAVDATDRVHVAFLGWAGIAYGILEGGRWTFESPVSSEPHELGGVDAWPTNLVLTTDGRPIISYHRNHGTVGSSYWLAEWTGDTWESHLIVDGVTWGGDSCDLALDHKDRPHMVYSVGQVPPNGGTIMFELRYATVVPPPLTWEAWLEEQRDGASGAPSEAFALEADPDHDGCSNLCEYGLGTQAFALDGPQTPVVSSKKGGGITVRLPGNRVDLEYVIERSRDLREWSGMATVLGLDRMLGESGYTVNVDCQRGVYEILPLEWEDEAYVRVRVSLTRN